jgi:hypothetical protein
MRRLLSLVALVVIGCAGHAVEPTTLALGDARVSTDGASIGALRIGLARVGRGALRSVGGGDVARGDADVRITRSLGVVEWWRTDQGGYEQGVDIAQRPSGDGPLVLEMRTNAASTETTSDDDIALHDADGMRVASYSNLVVVDATGTRVPATMRGRGASIVIEVDDANAEYPIVVDPVVVAFERRLTVAGATAGDDFGQSVALNADGSTAMVGRPQAHPSCSPTTPCYGGELVVYTRSGSVWTEVLPHIAGNTSQQLGNAVALSDDGTVALVNANMVFRAAGTTWSNIGSLSYISDSLSGDGQRVASLGANLCIVTLVGATGLSTEGTFSCPGAAQIAIDQTGSRIAVSGGDNSTSPATACVWFFARSGTTWTREASVCGYAGSNVGNQLVLSGDGTRAVVQNGGVPGMTFFVRTGTTWAVEQQLSGVCNGGLLFGMDASGSRMLMSTCNVPGVTLFTRTGTTWTAGPTLVPPNGDPVGNSGAISRDGSRAILGSPADNASLGTQAAADVFTLFATQGSACADDAECGTGHCEENVCCSSACGAGSTTDCQSCLASQTGGADGTCAALSAALAPTITCRPSNGVCDVPETCSSAMQACPNDGFMATGTVCRPSLGMCDAQEVCSGASAACPGDTVSPGGTVCRAPAGPCDVAEACTGSSGACPTDVFQSAGTTCNATLNGPCDVADTCSGTAAACPPTYAPTTVQCHFATGPCGRDQMCNGTQATCPSPYLTGNVCRMAAGGCDIAETCNGTSDGCPADTVEGAGTVCRASTDMTCDPAESCDGTSTACPADVTHCATLPDTGVAHDGGVIGDGGAVVDGSHADAAALGDASSSAPSAAGGCGCRAGGRASSSGLALVLAAWLFARRRRAG